MKHHPLVLWFLASFSLGVLSVGEISNSIEDHFEDTDTELFDLTYDLDENSVFYPGQRWDNFKLFRDYHGYNETEDGGLPYWFASYSFCTSEHGGTHIDAPIHYYEHGWTVNQIPLKRLVDLPTTVIDVGHYVFSLKQPDEFVLGVEHILEHEAKYGQIPPSSLVLVRFGWSQFWPNKPRYLGWDNSTLDHSPTLHFPGLSGDTANWLVKERRIVGIGTDTASPEIGNNGGYAIVHIILNRHFVYILENVANLDHLLERTRYHPHSLYSCDLRTSVLPIKTKGSGGPVRIATHCRH